MINFEDSYFTKFKFTSEQLKDYLTAAEKDLTIARDSNVPEVIFQFSYNALLKFGIVMIAKQSYRAHSKIGHHAKIIEKLAELLGDEEVATIGNLMRKTRNVELYSGGSVITEKQVREYLEFCERIANQVKRLI
jgi:hypothetical protein